MNILYNNIIKMKFKNLTRILQSRHPSWSDVRANHFILNFGVFLLNEKEICLF